MSARRSYFPIETHPIITEKHMSSRLVTPEERAAEHAAERAQQAVEQAGRDAAVREQGARILKQAVETVQQSSLSGIPPTPDPKTGLYSDKKWGA